MNKIRIMIAIKLADGPCYKRSFQMVKAYVDNMIGEGLIEPCWPPGGRARNMIRLTDTGRTEYRDALDIAAERKR
jgi:DNA-binding MarR family transcriptional regulator